MKRTLGLILICLLTNAAAAQVKPTNCTQSFNYSYTLDELLDQFRDDDIRHNLTKASAVFWSHPDLTPEYVYSALNHEDWQVRQIICRAIWQQTTDRVVWTPRSKSGEEWAGVDKKTIPADPDYTITADLIRVTIEGLRHDTTPYDFSRRRGLVYYNASFGVSRLIPIAHDWVDELEVAMESDDHQQRLLAAYILARGGVAQSVERASQILLPHLRDNDLSEDAKFCVYGLGGFGPELLPHLKEAMPAADPQQRDLIALLIVNLMDPVFTDHEREQRARYNTITSIVHDPSTQQGLSYWNWMSLLDD